MNDLIKFVLSITVIITLCYGWVMNIVKLVGMDEVTGMMFLRGFGIIVAPLGIVLGFL